MERESLAAMLRSRFPHAITTLDSHTAGEPTRLVIDYPLLPGDTIQEKRLYAMQHHDDLRKRLTQEPRGHRDLFAAILTEPVTPGAAFGLIYMDARRYPYLCGHGTIGAVTTMLATGAIPVQEPETHLVVDTPVGPVPVRATVREGEVTGVTIQAVPCFAYALEQPLEVPGVGRITADIAFAGGFFAMVDKDQIGIALTPENASRLAPIGMAIIEAANAQWRVQHPTQRHITTVDVAEFFDASGHGDLRGLNLVVYGEAHVDRSPCGTGTSAKVALLHRRHELAIGEVFTNHGILGTSFKARIVGETRVGDFPAVIPEFTGRAYVTGIHTFVLDSHDPFPEGFLI